MVGVSLQLPIIFGLLVQGALSWFPSHLFPKKIASQNPCSGYKNGTLVEHLLDCHYYWQCGPAGSATLQKCPTGYSFANGMCSKSNKACSLNPKACQGLAIDSYLPNLSNCQKLWICAAEGPLAASCPTNTTFDPNYDLCLSSSQCSGDVCVGLDITAQVPVQGDCFNYWQCSINGTTLKSCRNGYSFNPVALECQPSDVANCPPYVPFIANCSNVVSGSMIPGEYCDQFYVCNGDEPIKFVCDNDLVFNKDRGFCVATSTNYTCDIPLNPCKNLDVGSRVPVSGSCSNYLLCLDNGPVRLNCPAGFEFSLTDLQCVVASEAGCSVPNPTSGGTTQTLPTTTPTSGGTTQTLPTTTPVSESTTTKPPVTTEPTTVPTTVTQSPVDLKQLCSEHPRVTFLPYPGNCSLFVICMNDGESVGSCEPGDHFNGVDNCLSPEEAQCDPSYTTGPPTSVTPTTRNGDVPTGPTTQSSPTPTPTTAGPTSQNPSTAGQTNPTTAGQTNRTPSTAEPTNPIPTTTGQTNPAPSTAEPTNPIPTTAGQINPTPSPPGATNPVPSTTGPTNPAPSTVGPTNPIPTAPRQTSSAPSTVGQTNPTPSRNTEDAMDAILKKACENQPLGTNVNYPGTCRLYIHCSNPPTYTDCEDDYFSLENQNCGLFQSSECALKDIACANDVKIGKDPNSCSGYVLCTSDSPIFMPCNKGEGFDPVRGCSEDSPCQTSSRF